MSLFSVRIELELYWNWVRTESELSNGIYIRVLKIEQNSIKHLTTTSFALQNIGSKKWSFLNLPNQNSCFKKIVLKFVAKFSETVWIKKTY